MSEATVAHALKAGKLEGKYVKAVRDGDLELDAAILIADFNTSDSQSTEILEESIRRRERITDSMAKREYRKSKEKVAADIAEAKEKRAEALALSKDAEKRAEDAGKTLAKTKDKKELAAARKEKEDAEKARMAAGRDFAKAKKQLILANERKEKLAAQVPPVPKKAKATQEDVREVARGKGVKGIKLSPRDKDQLFVLFEVMGKYERNPLPKSAGDLIGKIEAYLDSHVSETQLEGAFRKYCVPDSK